MRAMVLEAPGRPLRPASLPVPQPGPGELLLKVEACGLCGTDLHVERLRRGRIRGAAVLDTSR
jgi:propanol-preferring alcohol dehydrogenase